MDVHETIFASPNPKTEKESFTLAVCGAWRLIAARAAANRCNHKMKTAAGHEALPEKWRLVTASCLAFGYVCTTNPESLRPPSETLPCTRSSRPCHDAPVARGSLLNRFRHRWLRKSLQRHCSAAALLSRAFASDLQIPSPHCQPLTHLQCRTPKKGLPKVQKYVFHAAH